jgi:hypothetical protein
MISEDRTQRRLEDELQQHRRLEAWLPTIATEEEIDAVGVHFGDLYGACEKLKNLIARLPGLDASRDRNQIRQELMHIHVELYSHMLPHMEELREGLDRWMQRLYDEVPDEPDEE